MRYVGWITVGKHSATSRYFTWQSTTILLPGFVANSARMAMAQSQQQHNSSVILSSRQTQPESQQAEGLHPMAVVADSTSLTSPQCAIRLLAMEHEFLLCEVHHSQEWGGTLGAGQSC